MYDKNEYEEEDSEEEFKVFIGHGRSSLWKDVARFIEKKLELGTVILEETVNRGRTVIKKLEDEAEDCNYAIIIMTAEDEQKDGNVRARQNVIHEIGFCQGKFGRENVLVLRQSGVEEFSNISGIVYESLTGDKIKTTFERIRTEIEKAYEDFELDEEDYDTDDEEYYDE